MTLDDFESHEDPYVRWDAAYVLGAMSAADRREYEAHLAHCAQCSQAVSELAGMPGLLALITPEEAFGTLTDGAPEVEEMPAPRVLTGLVGTVQRRRRQRRAAVALAAAAAVIAVAVPVAVLATQDRTPAAPVTALPAPDRANTAEAVFAPVVPTTITASASVVSTSWGTVIFVECSYADTWPGDGRYGAATEGYALTVTDRSGVVTTVATWTGEAGQTVRPTATTSLPLDAIASIDVRSDDDHQVLLTTAL
ncbi:zf-HC2 domain-containing protein [Rhodococcus pseudokoreensis]|uniref:Zf-HC2 domain-containing protein n=1 Tax=Rhodococcus pseudokoreensis TaxID=2811421 RepID=A0A974WC83_9NOCA|nr:zf-HC2 domain-containing protein [Rhodococcus pseudokoreensis]QSE94340.1 zf-HC2 domain-containing protein [Rhodococcus pseudokoreensis]